MAQQEAGLVLPRGPARAGVIVLHGSSGRPAVHRAAALGRHGYAAVAPQWFGGPDQPQTLEAIALESFTPAVDRLADLGLPLVAMGTSKGAEAALLLGALEPRIDVVVALAPTSVVWEGLSLDPLQPSRRSSWSLSGEELPFVPYVDQRLWTGAPFSTAREMYEASLVEYESRRATTGTAAEIAAEDISGVVVLAAGGDDPVWPSDAFARELVERRRHRGLSTTLLSRPDAGHRLVLPAEAVADPRPDWPMGGTDEGNRRLGAEVLEALDAVVGS